MRRHRPSNRIAAGFGGTLCLVISTLYILVVVLLTALPTHFLIAAGNIYVGQAAIDLHWLQLWLLVGMLGSIVLGIIATFLPLLMGIRSFKRMEF